jgi:hypothetical protein
VPLPSEAAGELEPIGARHPQVGHDRFAGVLDDGGVAGCAVVRFSHDHDVGLSVEDDTEQCPDGGVIIDDDDTEGRSRGHTHSSARGDGNRPVCAPPVSEAVSSPRS